MLDARGCVATARRRNVLFNSYAYPLSPSCVSHLHTGGNAALMAEYLATAGISDSRPAHNVTLVAHTGPKLYALLHPHIHVPPPCRKTEDELHLILEYQQHERFHGLTGARANRFIFSHDDTNGRMLAAGELQAHLAQSAAPDVLVLSGLNMLDGQNETVIVGKLNVRRGSRGRGGRGKGVRGGLGMAVGSPEVRGNVDQDPACMQELAAMLKAVPKSVTVHLELAR